ncbi:hypothetical protein TWF694_009568 [Orbilia ellipsospora]|uniref:B30.2/SPRY domain-containing protein n=1 Tax=Orbilia ellipsospora TaxID=2528407 RepID=A0AAV9XB65_9PEZI
MKPPPPRKTLTKCFDEACDRFREEIAKPIIKKDPKRSYAVEEFLSGTKMDTLLDACRKLNDTSEEKINNAARLLTTLDQLKTVGDVFMGFAPESVSIVWFGISSLIAIGSAKVQTRLLICGTCDSITNIVADCIRWEARMAKIEETASEINIWESDIPDLVFAILDFLWNARPHLDSSRIKRIGNTMKDLFTKEMDDKASSLVGKYEAMVKVVQSHFEDSVLHESLKTGQKIDQIARDIKQYASISSDLMDAVQRHALLYELDHHLEKLNYPESYKLHFSSLNDRLNKIIRDRKGRLPVSWLYKEEEAYQDWKKPSSKTKFLVLRAPRGHGKSVAMTSARREIVGDIPKGSHADFAHREHEPALLCHFFYKKGEQDIQSARAGLEAILYQLLHSRQLRQATKALVAALEALDPTFGESDAKRNATDFLDNLEALCATIRKVADAIPIRVYLMIDALDECVDRGSQMLTQHLRGIAQEGSDNIRIIISARDSFDIVSELVDETDKPDIVPIGEEQQEKETVLPEGVQIIEITPQKNAADLEEFISHDVGEVLQRRINKERLGHLFDLELTRIVKIMHEKAKGDFTLARMIIGTLQQPSKDSLDKKIQRLPAAIGEIYMQSIESLTPDEQELIVNALKWVVWSVAALTVVEVSDHYRDIFSQSDSVELLEENSTTAEGSYAAEVTKIIEDNPYEDPEVKDIIYHLENAGRDFFRLDRNTGLVGVDISIREWVQDSDPATKSTTQESRGFNKYRDPKGNTVFKFTLTSSFVRYGDSLSELFSKKDAHMSIAINILRALNNQTFQKLHMPWIPDWFIYCESHIPFDGEAEYDAHKRACTALGYESAFPSYLTDDLDVLRLRKRARQRYEVLHWHEHVRILQAWWTEGSLNDTWWTELLTQLSIFMRPENWYRWNIQRELKNEQELHQVDKLAFRFFDEPIHVAAELGLHLLIDLLVQPASPSIQNNLESYPQRESDIRDFKVSRLRSTLRAQDAYYKHYTWSQCQDIDQGWQYMGLFTKNTSSVFRNLSVQEAIALFNTLGKDSTDPYQLYSGSALFPLIEAMEHSLRIAWLASKTLEIPNPETNPTEDTPEDEDEYKPYNSIDHEPLAVQLPMLYDSFARREEDPLDLEKDVTAFLEQNGRDKSIIDEKLRDMIVSSSPSCLKPWEGSICDKPNPTRALPLYLAARHPVTVNTLLKHKADVNAPQKVLKVGDEPAAGSALLAIILDVLETEGKSDKNFHLLLSSAKALIAAGARLDVKTSNDTSIIHLAAQIRDLKFFKLLVVSWEWDVHAVDTLEMNPLHYLFKDPPPKDAEGIQEILDICQVIMKMRRIDGGDLVNAEDKRSQMPLSGAVKGGFREGVELLISLGADIHDMNDESQNYFHILAGSTGTEETEVALAGIFFNAGLDCTVPASEGATPLSIALEREVPKHKLLEFFLQKYEQLSKDLPEDEKKRIFLHRNNDYSNMLHLFTRGFGTFEEDDMLTEFFPRVVSLISSCTNIKEFISEMDYLGETPLDLAIRYRRQRILDQILDLDPETWNRNIVGYSALDAICEQIAKESVQVAKGTIFYEPRLAVSKSMFPKVLGKTEPFTLSHFETPLFDRDVGDPLFKELNLMDVVKTYDTPFVDPHGWTLFDLLSIYGSNSHRGRLASFCTQKSFSPQNSFARPSGIGCVWKISRVLENVYLPDEENEAVRDKIIWKPHTSSYSTAHIVADNPIPPVSKTFYFEVKTITTEEEPYAGFVSIGIQSMHNSSNRHGDDRSMIMFRSDQLTVDGDYESNFNTNPNFDYDFNAPRPDIKVDSYGCGMNYLENKIFFTINGKIVPSAVITKPKRYFPFIYTAKHFDDYKFNFGDEPFMFKLANEPDWQWDGVFEDKDILNAEIYHQPVTWENYNFGGDGDEENDEGDENEGGGADGDDAGNAKEGDDWVDQDV